MMQAASTPAHADAAFAVYLEPLARDARVLLFDTEAGAVAARLERVAGEIQRSDSPKLTELLGRGKRLPYKDGQFDLVVLVEGGALLEAARGGPLRPALVECVRVLSRDGVLVVAHPSAAARRSRRGEPEGDAFARELAPLLGNVRALAQTPLAGFALSPLTRDRVELAVDSRLVRDTPPEALRSVVVASDGALPDDGKLWIETPASTGSTAAVDPRIYESLRRAEDDAREALRRESELLREVEHLRRSEEHAQALEKRARSFEQKLLAAEADYDDAVGKVRYFEGQVTERERQAHKERELREQRERELTRIEGVLGKADAKLARANDAADEGRADAQAARDELVTVEAQLREAGGFLREAQAEAKRAQDVARDLVEELRRFEHGALERAEHDTRVVELSAERDRAVKRALEAEVARESAQLRADELRAELLAIENAPRNAPEYDRGAYDALENELQESERARTDAEQRRGDAERDRDDADAQLGDARALLADARERVREIEAELTGHGQRSAMLGRMVEERDGRLADFQLQLARADILARQVESLEQQLRAALGSNGGYAPIPTPQPAASIAEQLLRGEVTGLSLRLSETEDARRIAYDRATEAGARLAQAEERVTALRHELDRLAQQLEAAAQAQTPVPAASAERAEPREPLDGAHEDLREALAQAEQRIDDLSRELDEADRIAAVHAEDLDRIETLEAELETARRHMDELDDDVRGRDDEMRVMRAEAADHLSAAEGRAEEARRRENEARAERDAAHGALSEARGMLTQLAERFGVSDSEPGALLDALAQQTGQPSLVDALRAALTEAQGDRTRALERAEALERELDAARSGSYGSANAPGGADESF